MKIICWLIGHSKNPWRDALTSKLTRVPIVAEGKLWAWCDRCCEFWVVRPL